MCGRFAYHATSQALREEFALAEAPDLAPRYNVTPQSRIAVVREGGVALLLWGLVPFWARDPKPGYALINAKAETVATKPSFREAFKRRRCLIPVSGFYEWKRGDSGKQPWYMRPADRPLFAFAGLWEHWQGRGEHAGQTIESCTIITTAPNELCATIHDRMPVILDRADYARWLAEPAADLLVPYPAQRMAACPVSTRVNSPRNDGPELIEALAAR
ncbi:MAG: SOS response-associated peptidase [Gammaproteobacteria bacterium]